MGNGLGLQLFQFQLYSFDFENRHKVSKLNIYHVSLHFSVAVFV